MGNTLRTNNSSKSCECMFGWAMNEIQWDTQTEGGGNYCYTKVISSAL